MTTLRFGSQAANMLDPDLFGFGHYLSGAEGEIEFSTTEIVLRDPISGTYLRVRGQFDDSDEFALLTSPMTEFAMFAQHGELLIEWTGFQLTLDEFFFNFEPITLLADFLLAGNDSVYGSSASDLLLYGDFFDWQLELAVQSPIAIGEHIAMSADGSTLAGVVWREAVPGDSSNLRRDIVLIDQSNGEQQLMSSAGGAAASSALNPSLSRDGSLLVFRTSDPEFGGELSPIPRSQVIARDTTSDAFTLVSADVNGIAADGNCEAPVVSADGVRVAFTSSADNLINGLALPVNGRQVFSKHLASGEVALVSSNLAGEAANGDSFASAVSGDGRHVAFASYATNLVSGAVPSNGANLFVKDLDTGEVTFVASLGNQSFLPEPDEIGLALSLDGRTIAFTSGAADLVADDTNNATDVFVMDLRSMDIVRASVDEFGFEWATGAGSLSLALSGDGSTLAFHTRAGGLTDPWTSNWGNVYVVDLSLGLIERVSDPSADNPWTPIAMSADGLRLAFTQTLGGPGSGQSPQLVVTSVRGEGIDYIAGGKGDDLYFAEPGDTLFEKAGEGDDTVTTIWPTFTLAAHLENLAYAGEGYFEGTGNASNNFLTGAALSDLLRGEAGDDTIVGAGGDDVIDGGIGTDTAIFDTEFAAAIIGRAPGGHIVRDTLDREGADTLISVERLKYTDFTVNLSVQDAAASILTHELKLLEELYVAFFNRVPAANGLEYWISTFKSGVSIDDIAEAFYQAGILYPDLTGYSPGMTNEAFVHTVFRNVLGRPEGAAPDGLKYWSDGLASGSETHGSLVRAILESAHTFKGDPTWGWVADLLDNKITVADLFAVQWGLGYHTPQEAITNGIAIATAVTSTDTSAAIALIGIDPANVDL